MTNCFLCGKRLLQNGHDDENGDHVLKCETAYRAEKSALFMAQMIDRASDPEDWNADMAESAIEKIDALMSALKARHEEAEPSKVEETSGLVICDHAEGCGHRDCGNHWHVHEYSNECFSPCAYVPDIKCVPATRAQIAAEIEARR